jgi:hypothetical protein
MTAGKVDIIKFCQTEFQKVFVDDQQLLALCKAVPGGSFLPNGEMAAPILYEKIQSALCQKTPLSLVRVGDAEGNALGVTKTPMSLLQVKVFCNRFVRQNGIKVAEQDAICFCQDVRSALLSADIIGFRSFRYNEKELIEFAIRSGGAHAIMALGILYGREFLQSGLSENYLQGKIITDAWVHLYMLPFFDRILNLSDSIIVITGRSELEKDFSTRLGSRLREFISVPVQGFQPPSPAHSHFYEAFPKVRERLQQDLRGTLVLVGAGLFGKIYCHTARMNGGVALDIGSAFDILAGLMTRQVHKSYDVNPYMWHSPKQNDQK